MKSAFVSATCVASLFLVVLLFATSCNRTMPQPHEKVVIGVEAAPHSSPVWIAENKGYFKQEGLNVEIREFESGRTALRTMLESDGIDIATAAQTPVITYSFERNDYAVVGNMVYSDDDVKILVRQDRGVQGPRDLKGKRVGITAGSSGHFFLSLFLNLHKLSLSDVKTVDMEATHLAQALVDGKVDAISTWEPHIYGAQKTLGEKALVLPSSGVYREDFYFVARKDFIKNKPLALRRFLRAIQKSEDFLQKNNGESMDIVAQRLRMDKQALMTIWKGFRFWLFIDQSIIMALEDEARWAIRNKLVAAKKTPNYLDFIYTDALREVNPSSVTMAGKNRIQ